ncbi:MAG: hypothetical protein U1E83_04155 [Methylotetracoccus sp.]
MSLRKLAGLSRCALGLTLLCAAFPDASAHSEINLPPPYYVGEEFITAQYRIVHACTTNTGKSIPVIAQSFMLPTQNAVVSRPDGGKIDDSNGNGTADLEDVIDNGNLAGLIQPFINRSVFQKIQRKTDSPDLDNAVGFSGTNGEVPDKFYADMPFMLIPVSFRTDSCATELIVHPVGADICRITKSPKEGDANIWMEHTTAKFPNPVHGVGENALRISYKRNLKSLPLTKGCGKGYTVDVFASDEDIDANLPIPGVWPKP